MYRIDVPHPAHARNPPTPPYCCPPIVLTSPPETIPQHHPPLPLPHRAKPPHLTANPTRLPITTTLHLHHTTETTTLHTPLHHPALLVPLPTVPPTPPEAKETQIQIVGLGMKRTIRIVIRMRDRLEDMARRLIRVVQARLIMLHLGRRRRQSHLLC
jgi:hypothetical protein